jgi:hypothetical protein
VGRTVKLKVWREGKPTELDVVVGAYQQGAATRPTQRGPQTPPPGPQQPPSPQQPPK